LIKIVNDPRIIGGKIGRAIGAGKLVRPRLKPMTTDDRRPLGRPSDGALGHA
jgi:hypothetical protein